MVSEVEELRQYIVDLEDEVRALTADARRYRWLVGGRTQEQADDPDVGMKMPIPQDEVLSHLASWYCTKRYADTYIDAASQNTKE